MQLYLPAYPTKAFFRTIESKLLTTPPAPATVVYSITKACDYNCPHCYQHKDSGSDIGDELLISTALKIRDTGVTMFDIEGGEPFLKFDRLTKLVKALGDGVEIWINTHGGNVNETKLQKLKDAGLFGLMVSIHSPNAAFHDDFTGKQGSFHSAQKAIELCKKLDLTVAINSVLTQEQIQDGQLEDLMELGKKLKCDFVQLIHPKPAGNWLKNEDQIQQSKKLIADVEAKHKLYNSPGYRSYPSLAAQVFEERKHGLGCTAGGVDRFYINAAGEIQPCEFLNISFGNVNNEDFDIIFKRMRNYFNTPCSDWLCCTASQQIADLIDKHQLKSTPVPWNITRELVVNWDRGKPTPLYKKLGIYN